MRVMLVTPRGKKASWEEWSPGSTAVEKCSKMRSGHMVISGLGKLNKSYFGGRIRSDWSGLRSEWEVKKCRQLMCLTM